MFNNFIHQSRVIYHIFLVILIFSISQNLISLERDVLIIGCFYAVIPLRIIKGEFHNPPEWRDMFSFTLGRKNNSLRISNSLLYSEPRLRDCTVLVLN